MKNETKTETKPTARILQGPGVKKVDLNAPVETSPAVLETQPAAAFDVPLAVNDEQIRSLQKAIIIGSAINGMLAAGRLLNVPENVRQFGLAIAAGMEKL
jgi:hypothetical protein